jgi:hypothetical protein
MPLALCDCCCAQTGITPIPAIAAEMITSVGISFFMWSTTAELSKINLKNGRGNPIFHARFTGL